MKISIKKIFFVFGILSSLVFISSCTKEKTETSVKQELLIDLEKLQNSVIEFQKIAKAESSSNVIQKCFKENRLLYKKVEWAIEYFSPETARFMNGPALDELEVEENKFLPPNGFQVMEELIFPVYNTVNKTELQREIAVMSANIMQVKQHLNAITISDNHIIDAARFQVYRIIALGITGFDSPIAFQSVNEIIPSLSSVEKITLKTCKDNSKKSVALKQNLKKTITESNAYCKDNNNFDTFDRALFIRTYLNPISKILLQLQKQNNIPNVNKTNAINPNSITLFEKNTFDVNAFIPSDEYFYSKEKVSLGSKLFYDVNISKDQRRSCASCHNPEKAFTDGQKTNISLEGGVLNRNTPTLTYAGFQNALFWDLRQPDLEKQSMEVIANKEEMHGSFKNIIPIVTENSTYKTLFAKAFPKEKKVEEWQLQNAIASYIRSLNDFDSKFDQYIRGDSEDFSEQEKLGFNLFAGKAKCATCHFIPLFNGTVPPNYNKTEQEVIGTPATKKGIAISPDLGKYNQYKMPQLKNAFKTPSLRNTAKTAPYMHNGVYTTLEEVVDFYNKGGGKGLGYSVENQTLPFEKLNLSKKEELALVAFMKTLTDVKYQ
ncbi:cytochrome-c peroxidase [Flavobacterium rhamnosiphilum]|uniref:Cytochrome-c peroxidase n=1 Tax=Flavobacterium rhamnosiphilum TaxID=2541724 RepID=A0A4R5F5B1_9FLAO|nr:cytochrome c peroxidase [Flavobacterium rhamnosiphilum]TDE42727.1 cytochrome-c peroxidase [Flavobacterium rhamnosiphilum]